MAQYLMSPGGSTGAVAPSLEHYRRGVGTNGTNGVHGTNGINGTNGTNGVHSPIENPTVVPPELLKKYQFTFLIRHPRSSIPSYYRCTVPPLCEMTGFPNFDPAEAGYRELRLLFDYLQDVGHIGPQLAGKSECDTARGKLDICVVDADDLLDNPNEVIEAFCKSTGLEYSPQMLKWDDEQTQKTAKEAFEKWKGFHEDALGSRELKPRTHVSLTTLSPVQANAD
jgi:hypothetical protein